MTENAATRRATPRPKASTSGLPRWCKAFLAELAATSNVSAAALVAGIPTSTAYDLRRSDPGFCRLWQAALCEGYDNLEMELLERMRCGDQRPEGAPRASGRAFDNATALRLLSAHRETVARERALQGNEDAEAVLAAINAKLETMRERMLAGGAGGGDDGAGDAP